MVTNVKEAEAVIKGRVIAGNKYYHAVGRLLKTTQSYEGRP